MKFLIKLSLLFLLFFTLANGADDFSKDYYKMPLEKQKKYFFEYFSKKIELENIKILKEREFILSLNGNKNLIENSKEYKQLISLQQKYKVQNLYNYEKYLVRIDIIPPSMALAQAATESGWGKSRFFKKANNIFGHWTYNPKIGMVPLQRPEGKKHLVRVFPTLQASIEAYMRNLNRTGAYYEFRLKREAMRKKGIFINGFELSSTMDKYSGIGHEYAKILKSIIRKNNLINFDIEFFNKIKKEKLQLK